MEGALIALRFGQYLGVATLFGASLFGLYALPRSGTAAAASLVWPRRLLLAAATLTIAAAAAGVVVQTAVMAGSVTEALKPESLRFVALDTGIGRGALLRVLTGALALSVLLVLRPGRRLWMLVSALGLLAAASLGWMGHGAATEGSGRLWHLVSDVLHSLAACIWIGALAAFLALLWPRHGRSPELQAATHRALEGFSGLGSALVAVLVVTGLVNSWFLVGLSRLESLWTTPYGQLLLAKLIVFGAMLALAAANRFRLTPRLRQALEGAGTPAAAVAALRRSLVLETGAGLAVLALVAWLGTLAPVSAA